MNCTYRRTAFFDYTVHWYVFHALRIIAFFAAGHTMAKAGKALKTIPMRFVLLVDGDYKLWVAYVI